MYTAPSALRRDVLRCLAAGAALAVFAVSPAAAQDPEEFTGTFSQLNDSGLSGEVDVSLSGTTAEVTVSVDGVVDLVHAQHFHGEYGYDNVCPTADNDTDGDGLVNTVEGASSYGTVKVSLVTEGPTDESYALAIEAFPVASGGSYEYTRSIEVPQEFADNLENMIVVVHGIDIDDSGEYDGDAPSSLDESLPLEATIPAGCATLVSSGVAPAGPVAAGAGGTANSDSAPVSSLLWLAAAASGGLAVITTRARRRQA